MTCFDTQHSSTENTSFYKKLVKQSPSSFRATFSFA